MFRASWARYCATPYTESTTKAETIKHLALGPRNERLNDRAALVIEQMHLVDDEQAYRGCHRHIATLARNHIPLLRGCHNHLGLCQLPLRQLHIPRQLSHHHPCPHRVQSNL